MTYQAPIKDLLFNIAHIAPAGPTPRSPPPFWESSGVSVPKKLRP